MLDKRENKKLQKEEDDEKMAKSLAPVHMGDTFKGLEKRKCLRPLPCVNE